MNKIINFLVDISMTTNCMYILICKVLLIGITSQDTGVSKGTSLTIGISKLHFTFIIAMQKEDVLDSHGIS